MKKTSNEHDEMDMAPLNSPVPQDHILRDIDKNIDFNFMYQLVKDLDSNVRRASGMSRLFR